ncbi:MAG: NAD(P)-binding protein [Pseudomonadota bacterium]|nr:NAD(P)-binding protein [Pseudomonadota bacterium]
MSASAFAMSCLILGAIPSDVDVAVIGAGMAEFAAAQRIRAGGLRAAVSEARSRIGGRAFTEHQSFGVPLNHGCAWTHADAANPFVQISDRFGFGKIWTPISPVCSTIMGKCPRRRTCAWTPLTVVYKQ